MATVAISGANGHIGAALVRALLAQGHKVRALIFHHQQALTGLPINRVFGDACDPKVLERLVSGADFLINLAAVISIWPKDAEEVYALNEKITQQAIQVCLNFSLPLIHFSSIHSLQIHPRHERLDETRPWVGSDGTAYERSKATGERLILEAVAHHGLRATIINPTAVLGPYDFYPSLLGQAIISIYRRKMLLLLQGGYNFVDVRDIALATIQAMNGSFTGEKYILGGHYLTLRELVTLINRVKGRHFPFIFINARLALMTLPFINLWSIISGRPPLFTRESINILATGHTNISITKAQEQLSFNPRPMEDSIKDILEWYKSQNLLK